MQIAVLCPFMKPVSIGYAEGIIEHLMGLKIKVIVDEQLHTAKVADQLLHLLQ